jgi:hypothetical protein
MLASKVLQRSDALVLLFGAVLRLSEAQFGKILYIYDFGGSVSQLDLISDKTTR